jgi:nucleotide-binding universal stress UspA family protein
VPQHPSVNTDPRRDDICSTARRTDAADALVGFAGQNRADHVVIGARASSALRRYLGSVSAQVVAEAPYTVTVVRTGISKYHQSGYSSEPCTQMND